jgi:peptidoglycan hydrolase-like protein with peptidoglycan-binding domain
MPLQSNWFRGNARLQQCLTSNPSHVQKGDRGEHVTLIQGALMVLDKSQISIDEQASGSYGQSTAKAVLEYKKKRNIINISYQQSADDIVGRMTIQALDIEVFALELASE